MSRESEKLFDGITGISDDVITAAHGGDGPAGKKRRRNFRWVRPVAAVVAIAILTGLLLGRGTLNFYALAEAEYPKERERVDTSIYSDKLGGFLAAAIPELLSGAGDGNLVVSPLNVYMALSMLAETTAGETRAQILSLLGAETLDEQRERAKALWNANYFDEREGRCILAASLWLDQDVGYVQETVDTLARNYRASSYRGAMGSPAYDRALQAWLDKQTGNRLREQAAGLSLNPETVMALVSTVYFRGKWNEEFAKGDTAPALFHAPAGDMRRDFMRQTIYSTYYWGERFGAISHSFSNGCSMWFYLPDEGVSPEELLEDPEFLEFLGQNRAVRWDRENQKYIKIHLSIPKFDVASELDLLPCLEALGITDALSLDRSDYTPLTAEVEELYLAQAPHAARVTIDEEGCVAVSYVVLGANASGAPPVQEEEMNFILDRPFLFAIAGSDGLPLFTGIIHDPAL